MIVDLVIGQSCHGGGRPSSLCPTFQIPILRLPTQLVKHTTRGRKSIWYDWVLDLHQELQAPIYRRSKLADVELLIRG